MLNVRNTITITPPTAEEHTFTANGAYNVQPGKWYNRINVNVDGEDPGMVDEALTITENGETWLEDGVRANPIITEVPGEVLEVEELLITENGTYTTPAGKKFDPIIANVSGGGVSEFLGGATFDAGNGTGMPKFLPDEQVVDYDGATSNSRGTIANGVTWAGLTSWEMSAKISNYTPDQNIAAVVFGSPANYWYNPSIEIQSGGSLVWAGCSTANGSFATTLSYNLDETMTSEKIYRIVLGWDGEKLYSYIEDVLNSVQIGYGEVTAAANPQTYSVSGYPVCLMNCATQSTSRFSFGGKLHLSAGTYIKENGVLTWGAE